MIEVDIPQDLQTAIDSCNQIFKYMNKNDKSDNKEDDNIYFYKTHFDTQLNPEQHTIIAQTEKLFDTFITETLNKIFEHDNKYAISTETTNVGIRVKMPDDFDFHKDGILSEGTQNKTHFTVIYPFLDAQGTAYVPYNKKSKYPEDNTGKEAILDRGYLYPLQNQGGIKPEDVQYADPSKILIFLCRQASRDLGEDFDDKSLIHAIPEASIENPRIMMLSRYALEENTKMPPK